MRMSFEKWQGSLNDFIVIRLSDADGQIVQEATQRVAPRLCSRRQGIGADGILLLIGNERSSPRPHSLVIINSDGSLAANCGNGVRCAVASILRTASQAGRSQPDADEWDVIELQVESQVITSRILRQTTDWAFVTVEMGVPKLGDVLPWHQDAVQAVRTAAAAAGLSDYSLSTCEIGNPHLVIATPHASPALARALGPALQKTPLTSGINVHVVRPVTLSSRDHTLARGDLGGGEVGDALQAFVWERGAGETMACGSGVAAIAAVSFAEHLTSRADWVAVDMPGGRLYARQDDAKSTVTLAGPATFVFDGLVDL